MLAKPGMLEPRIDVDAWGHPALPHMRLDITVVDPDAERYQQTSDSMAPAAEKAERGKVNKYGGIQGGVAVQGLGLELSGRLGPTFDRTLRQLAGMARAERAAFGQEQGRHLAQWHSKISLMLARFVAACVTAVFETAPTGVRRIGLAAPLPVVANQRDN